MIFDIEYRDSKGEVIKQVELNTLEDLIEFTTKYQLGRFEIVKQGHSRTDSYGRNDGDNPVLYFHNEYD